MCALFSGWYLSFECEPIQRVSWPISTVARNAYYLSAIIASISILKWIRDPMHKYFIFIHDKRKRTILHQYKYRQNVNNNKLLYERDHAYSLAAQQKNSRNLLMAPPFIQREIPKNEPNRLTVNIHAANNNNNNNMHQYPFRNNYNNKNNLINNNNNNNHIDDDESDEEYQQMNQYPPKQEEMIEYHIFGHACTEKIEDILQPKEANKICSWFE